LAEGIVIIPTFNEKENIVSIIEHIMALEDNFHVLVVDDNSPDGTAQLVHGVMERFPGRVYLEERKGKLGLGTAYIHGFHWCLKRDYEYIIEMDADFSHPPEKLSELMQLCKTGGADVAVGSRYVKGGRLKNWPFSRIFISYGASLYVRLITWMWVKDPTAGFVCYKRKVLETIDLYKIRFVGYAFQIEMKFATHSLGFKIKEIPITFTDREIGVSKMSKSIFKEAFWGVWAMKFKSFAQSYARQNNSPY